MHANKAFDSNTAPEPWRRRAEQFDIVVVGERDLPTKVHARTPGLLGCRRQRQLISQARCTEGNW
jgi:hypothetical protein